MRAIGTLSIAALVALVSCSRSSTPTFTPKDLSAASRQILDASDQFVLLSLEPVYPSQPSTDVPEKFHDYPILGRIEIKNGKEKAELLAALYKGIKDSNGAVAACFNPRHGIRALSGTNWVELVICFECSYMQEYGSGAGDGATTTKSPSETFNRPLRQAGLPITTR